MLKKLFSAFLLVLFPFQILSAETPVPALALQNTVKIPAESRVLPPLDLPSEFISLEKFVPSGEGILVHLQTVHGNYEVQKNLAHALRFLQETYGIGVIMIEGAAGPLDPARLEFLPNEPELNGGILDLLARGGYAKAPELFLSDYPDVPAEGIEDAELYRANLKAYADSARKRAAAEAFTRKLRSALLARASAVLPAEVRELLRLRQRQHEAVLPLDAWIEELARTASDVLGIDVRSPLYQFDWPMLTRWFALKRLQEKSAAGDLEKEQNQLSSFSAEAAEETARLISPDTLEAEQTSGRDFLSGSLVSLAAKTGSFPALLAWMESRFLADEMRVDVLMLEEKKLTAAILEKLAVTPEQKQTAAWFEDVLLMERALALSLSRSEWLSIKDKKGFMPSELLSAVEGDQPGKGPKAAEADQAMTVAKTFYRYAIEREDAMNRLIARVLSERRPGVAVLITGGFHGPAAQETAASSGYSYALASPVMSEAHDQSIYGRSIMETMEASTLETVPFTMMGAQDLDEHGVSSSKFHAVFMRAAELAAGGDSETLALLAKEASARWLTPPSPAGTPGRSELRSSHEPRQINAEAELKIAEAVIQHYPEDGPNDSVVHVQALLAAVYGGSFQYYQKRSRKTTGGMSWEQVRAENLRGLATLAGEKLSRRQKERAEALQKTAFEKLKELGVRAEMAIPSVKGAPSLGDLLSDHPSFENPFLHTFLGTRRTALRNRLSKAFDAGKFDAQTEIYLRSYDHVYQMRMPAPMQTKYGAPGSEPVPGVEPYGIRVQHNDLAGPYKGGIRFVYGSLLKGDAEFMRFFNQLADAGLNLTELRYFLRKWVREETLALALGMSIKTAVTGLPYGGGKGALLMADVYPTAAGGFIIEDLSAHYPGDPVELRNFITRSYTKNLYASGFIGPSRDIPAPDIGSRASDMNLMAEEVIQHYLQNAYKREKVRLPEALRIRIEAAQARAVLDSSEPYVLQALWQYLAQAGTDNSLEINEAVTRLTALAATFTSKSIPLGGSRFREEATGYGGIHALKEILKLEVEGRGGGARALSDTLGRPVTAYDRERPLTGLTAKIMGFGNAGGWAVTQLLKEGALLTAISEGPFGIVRKTAGFTASDIQWLLNYKRDHGGFHGLAGSPEAAARKIELIGETAFLGEPSDVYVLAAKENLITPGNMEITSGKIFLEIANGAITQEGYEYLTAKALVIPDSIANAGGVTVSYFEWVQNLTGEIWTEADVIRRLENQMSAAITWLDEIRRELSASLESPVDWRTTADVAMIRLLSGIYRTGRKPVPPFPVPTAGGARSELRTESAGEFVIDADAVEKLKLLPEPFIPLDLQGDRSSLLEPASALLGPDAAARNPLTWPEASNLRSREETAIPEPAVLRNRLGLDDAEAFIIGKSFAVDYGALPVLRRIIEGAPAVIIAPDGKVRALIEDYNEKTLKEGGTPFFIAENAEEALRLLREARPEKPAFKRYAGLLATGDLALMEASALKDQLVDWVIKTPGEFSQYLVQNHLDAIVQSFSAEYAIRTAA